MRTVRALLTLALCGGLTGCLQRPCTPGTVLVAVAFSGDTDAADTLDITLTAPGTAQLTRSIARAAHSGAGTIEVAFSAGYPHLQQLSLRIVARHAGVMVGSGSVTYRSGTSCDTLEIAILSIGGEDLAVAPDLASSDLAVGDLAVVDLAPATPPPDLAMPAPVCSVDHWCWSNPQPQGAAMVQTFGFAANDVWAVGEAGTILHFDGHGWRGYPGVTQADLWTVWGLTPTDVWAAGQGVILHFDGKAWQVVFDEGANLKDTFVSLWGSATNDVYVTAGTTNVVGHWDGKSWTLGNLGDDTETFTAVAGSGPNDIWIVGDQLWHSDGTGFVPAATQPDSAGPALTYIYVVGPGDAWLAGPRGRILHWSGGAFTTYAGVTKATLEKIWGRGADDIWVCGTGGAVAHWNGSAWDATYTIGTTAVLWGGWSAAANDVWFTGDRGILLHYDGTTFSSSTSGPFADLADIWGSGAHDIWAVGSGGAILHDDGTGWTTIPSGTVNSLSGVWGTSASNAWAVGDAGTILHWDGTGWTAVDSGVTFDLVAVWGSRGNDVWAVGGRQSADPTPTLAAPILHWNGSAWSGGYTFSSPLGNVTLHGARNGSSAGTVLTVGEGDPKTYQTAAFAAAYPGSGSVWTVTTIDGQLRADDVYSGVFTSFIASGGSIYTSIPSGWTAGLTVPRLSISGLWGSAENDIYAVGSDYGGPTAYHWSGSQWSPQQAGCDTLKKVWGSSTHDVWAVGNGGTILHKSQ